MKQLRYSKIDLVVLDLEKDTHFEGKLQCSVLKNQWHWMEKGFSLVLLGFKIKVVAEKGKVIKVGKS